MKDTNKISKRHQILAPLLDEKSRRLMIAAESKVLGHGGIGIVSRSTGVSRTTISAGLKELKEPDLIDSSRIRKAGGGRKKAVEKLPAIVKELEKLIEPALRGEPDSPFLWTGKSLRKLSAELKSAGFDVSHKLVGEILKNKGFSLLSNRKTEEGKRHHDRNTQLEHIHLMIKDFQKNNQPVITVVANNGLSVGMDHETSEFAVETIKKWYTKMGKPFYPDAQRLLITADCGGGNSSGSRMWKTEIQKLCNETGLTIEVCHFPPATSKWNKIEHSLISGISQNWKDKPLVSYRIIVSLIASAMTEKGLEVNADLVSTNDHKGMIATDQESENITKKKNDFHEEWNYTIKPK